MSEVNIIAWHDEESKTTWDFRPKTVCPNAVGLVFASELDRVTAENSALQARLTAADELNDVLEGLLRQAKKYGGLTPKWHDAVEGALKPAEDRGEVNSSNCTAGHPGSNCNCELCIG